MKEKIRQLAKEKFEYELPNILLSEEKLEITVEAGSRFMGSFVISNETKSDMKGIVYTSCSNFRITNPMFIGKKNEIQFVYDAKRESFKQRKNGTIHIVSNCGEKSLSIDIHIIEPHKTTSLGRIKDLFHFANLAKSDWEEALKLFVSSDFERIFLKEEALKTRYYSLMKSMNWDNSMEEFLISIQKKAKIQIAFHPNQFEYTDCTSDFIDTILLEKDTWGYQNFHISSDSEFISFEKTKISTKEFCGNRYELEFLIEKDKLYEGINFGRIWIETPTNRKEIPVKVCVKHESENTRKHKKREEVLLAVTQNYINLRSNQISQDVYTAELELIIKKSKECCSNWEQKLLELHACILNYQDYAKVILAEMEESIELIKEESLLCYSTYLYLRALYYKNKETINEAVSFIRAYYENGFDSWQLLWFLLYLGDSYDTNPEKKWLELAQCIDDGANSPIIYYEACVCLEDNMKARTYFSKSLHKILAFGVKMNVLSEELTDLFCFLSEQEKKVSPWIMRSLYCLYERTQSKEVLYTICRLLICNQKKDEKYFKWYKKGEEEKLKLENLYEYYIETMPEDFKGDIPTNLFLFFQYDNQLSFEKKAFFYAYIVKNKNRNKEIYETYETVMRRFSLEALKAEKIDANLSILYKTFFGLEDVNERLSIAFSNVMFRQELICEDKNIVGVYITHKEVSKEVYTPLLNGRCYVDIFTENPSIVFINARGNRFIDSVSYKLTRLFHMHGLALKCYEHCKSNRMLMLNLFEKIYKYQKKNEYSMFIQRRCVVLPLFKSYYKGKCFESLIEYYMENMEIDSLKEMLLLADFNWLSKEFRPKAITYCMIYELYERANYLLQEYGFLEIPIARLLSFCTEEIKKKGMETKDKFLLEMAFYLFTNEKYNETLLQYLMLYLEWNSESLLKLWEKCGSYHFDTLCLEERILTQVLFTENQVLETLEVFKCYEKKETDETIIWAYLSCLSYRYFMSECPEFKELIPIIKKKLFHKKTTIGSLALLLFYSKQETLTKEELDFCESNIDKWSKEGLIFPFYKTFSEKITLPYQVNLYSFVAYTSNPNIKVNIHYRVENKTSEGEYVTEYMENVYFGIHVTKVLLFEGETLQYYISKEDGTQEAMIESISMKKSDNIRLEEPSLFQQLNTIIRAQEQKDEKKMLKEMECLVQCNYTVEKLLKIL